MRGHDLRAGILIGCWLVAAACATPTLEDRRLERVDPRDHALSAGGPPRRVLLLTVPGLTASDYLSPDGYAVADGAPVRMPRLARLAREGAAALSARPPTPGASLASHATLATGRRPPSHGIVADAGIDAASGQPVVFQDNRRLRGTALWDAAVGRGVLSLGWPTTAGARIELLVPHVDVGAGSWLEAIRSFSSPMLVAQLEEIAANDLESGLLEEEGAKERTLAAWPMPRERDAAFAELGCRLAASDRDPGLWLIRFGESADALHRAGPGSLEVAGALRRIDGQIARLVDCLETAGRLADTAIVVSGDVAWRPVHTRVLPNVRLVKNGLIGRDPRAPLGVRSWLARVRSHGVSAYVYAKDAQNALTARALLEETADRTGAFSVVPAGALAGAGADPQAWFGLVARPGYQIGEALVGPELAPATARGAAGVLRAGEALSVSEHGEVGLVFWGRGIRSRIRLPEAALVDVAPTIAALLGLRLDDDVEGQPILGLLRAAVPPPPPGPRRLGGERGAEGALEELRRDRGAGSLREREGRTGSGR